MEAIRLARITVVRRSAWLLLATWIASFIALCDYYSPFLSDDALISFRYAQRLASGHGLTWTAGERVEGYTNLLWVLIHAPFVWFDFDLIVVTRWIGGIGAAAGMFAMASDPVRLRLMPGRALAGAGYLALLVPYAVWAVGGLEHGFMAGVLCVALVLAERHVRIDLEGADGRRRGSKALSAVVSVPGLSIVLSCLTLLRADGILLAGLLCAGVTLAGLPRIRGLMLALRLAVGPILAAGAQLGFRLAYYGDWVPNTARAKISLEHSRWEAGLEHVWAGVSASSVGIALALVAFLVASPKVRRRALPALVVSLGWLGYQASVGGDIFPSFRQVLLGLAPLAHVVALGADDWRPQLYRPAFALGLGAVAALHVGEQMRHPENERGKTERWEWAGESVGGLLRSAFSEREPLLAVDAAGALPYWSGLPSLDLLGLNDRYLATHLPDDFGLGGIGHELGDADYYLERKVDLFAFCGAAGHEQPCFQHSKKMAARPEYRKEYRMVRLEGLAPRKSPGAIHVRLDGKIGITRTDDLITLPGYFLASEKASVRATLGPSGELGVLLSLGNVGIVDRLQMPPGRWELSHDGGSDVALSVRCQGRDALRTDHSNVLALEGPTVIDVAAAFNREQGSARITRLTLSRSNELPSLFCGRRASVHEAQFLGPPLEGADFRAPPAVRILEGGAETRLQVSRKSSSTHLSICADGNDRLLAKVRSGEVSSPTFVIPPVSGGGTRTRRVLLPEGTPAGPDVELILTVSSGDGLASVRSAFFD